MTGLVLREFGSTGVATIVVAAEPQQKTLEVAVNPRSWGLSSADEPVKNPEQIVITPIVRYRDLGEEHLQSEVAKLSTMKIDFGPNRGCVFVDHIVKGGKFTLTPEIHRDVVNTGSAFQQAQGGLRVSRPKRLRGTVIPPSMYDVDSSGSPTIKDPKLVAAQIGANAGEQWNCYSKVFIEPQRLLAEVRAHEYTGLVSHQVNVFRAWRALNPKAYIEGFIQTPDGVNLNFERLFEARIHLVEHALAISKEEVEHREVDEAATRAAGSLSFVPGSTIPAPSLPVWNLTKNEPLHN